MSRALSRMHVFTTVFRNPFAPNQVPRVCPRLRLRGSPTKAAPALNTNRCSNALLCHKCRRNALVAILRVLNLMGRMTEPLQVGLKRCCTQFMKI